MNSALQCWLCRPDLRVQVPKRILTDNETFQLSVIHSPFVETMASTHNAFELLFGSEQSSKPGSKKKRNKKKQHIVALQGAPLLTEVPQAVPAEVDDDHGFQPVPHHQIIKLRANSKAYNNSEGEKQHALPSASSVCASIEKDASNLSASSRAVVVDKWTRQAGRS